MAYVFPSPELAFGISKQINRQITGGGDSLQ